MSQLFLDSTSVLQQPGEDLLVSDKYSSKKIFWKHQNNLSSHRTATFYGRPLPLVIEVVDEVVDDVVDEVVDDVVVAATVA